MAHSTIIHSCSRLFGHKFKILKDRVPASINFCQLRTLWDRQFEWTEDLRAKLTDRYDISRIGYETYEKKKFRKKIREGQKFAADVYNNIGPDLYASTFILTRGGSVRFTHDDIWYSEATANNIPAPPKDEGYRLEGIDAADMIIMLEGMDSLRNLQHLRFLRLKNMFELEDWHLFTLHKFESLEFLDISDNPRLTDRGLESLYAIKNLKVVDVSNCTGIENGDLVAACLQQLNPELTVIGLDPSHSLQEDFVIQEMRNSRFLNLGSHIRYEDDQPVEVARDESDVNTNSAHIDARSSEVCDKNLLKEEDSKIISIVDRIRRAMFREVK